MLASALTTSCTKNRFFPNFVIGSPIVRSNMEIEKIFPKIGLPNFREAVDVKLNFDDMQLDKVIHLAVKKWLEKWKDDGRSLSGLPKGLEQFKMSRVLYVLQELDRRFNKREGIGTNSSGKVVLTTGIPSYDGKALIKSGSDCFKLVKTLLNYGSKYAHIDLMSSDDMRDQCKNLHVMFRSDGLDGAWDLVTMSMRGPKSCMRWEAKQSPALVGSIVDPGCGIIYLTNDSKTPYGPKMLFRAVVRLAILIGQNGSESTPTLMIDRVYSSFYKNKLGEVGKFDQQIKQLFIAILAKKANCEVLDAQRAIGNNKYHGYVLPRFPNIDLLNEIEFSYRDTDIPYGAQDYKHYLPQIRKTFKTKPSKRIK